MTSQRLVEDFARYLWERDTEPRFKAGVRIPDSYMNEAAVFLAGELGQRLQHARQIEAVRALHEQVLDGGSYWCDADATPWPCWTIRTLDGGAS